MPVRVRVKQGKEYFSVAFKLNGKLRERGLGYSSDGWTREKAEAELRRMQELRNELSPPKRDMVSSKHSRITGPTKPAKEPTKELKSQTCMTFKQAFELFFDHASTYKASWRDDRHRYNRHLKESISHLPLDQIRVGTIEQLKLEMQGKGLSPASQVRVLALVRVVFNHCIRLELFDGSNPVSKVRMPKVNNARLRYLTRDEAELILDSIHHPDVRDACLMSLYSGMRRSEILGLTWADVDLDRGAMTVRDTKNGSSRTVFMHHLVKDTLLRRRLAGEASGIPSQSGKVFKIPKYTLSPYFKAVIDHLGLNDGITDRRQRVSFHTLRHTFASWQAERGVDLRVLMDLLGHKSLAMTLRYSHLSDSRLREAVSSL